MIPPHNQPNPGKGEVWLVNFDPTVGDEIQKIRPAIVMGSDSIGVLALRVVVPLTIGERRGT